MDLKGLPTHLRTNTIGYNNKQSAGYQSIDIRICFALIGNRIMEEG